MVDKFDSTSRNPSDIIDAKALGSGGDDRIDIEEVGTQVDINLSPDQVEDSVEIIEDGSAIVGEVDVPVASGFNANLAEILDEGYLGSLSNELMEKVENDRDSREDWEQSYTKGLDLLGFKYEERTRPFRGAASVHHPVLAQAVTQFQAMAYVELLPSDGPVRTQVVGAVNEQLQQAAERVKEYMNYEITHVMEDYNPEMDQLLFQLPLSGSAFKKVYFDENLQRATSKFIPAEDVVVPYGASDLDSCDRITQIVKMSMNDLRKKQVSGFYRDIPLKPYDGDGQDDIQEKIDRIDGTNPTNYRMDDMAELFEMHVDLDLEGFEDINPRNGEPSGIKLPYVVTIDKGSNKVLSIYRNYNEGDPLKRKNDYFVHYKFLPGLGFYGFGLIHMIGGLTRTATSALRQLLDAGTLSNLPAGFKSRGFRIRDEAQPLQPGEFRDVDAPNGVIREALMPLPYKGPDAVLMQLLGFCVDAAKQFATVADMQLSEIGSSQTPVGTTMALMERGTKVMSAVHKRLHYAQKKEFELLAKIFKMALPPVYPFNVQGGPRQIKAMDFDDNIDILPVSDPNIFSMSQRVTLAQNQLQLAQSNPQMHNLREAYRRMYIALGVKDIEQILPLPQPPQPQDPAMEHSVVLRGAPLQAFPQQNHELHIKAHRTFMTSALVKANPMAVMNLVSHINQHVSLLATQTVDQAMVEEAEKLRQQYGDQVPPQALQALQMQRATAIDNEIVKITEQMVIEEQESMQDQNMDPLVMLKQQELALRQAEQETAAQFKSLNQDLKEAQFGYKQTFDSQKLQKDYDLAELRANVARERNNVSNQEG
jgi:chaperonin GroES